jgi:predicted ArsR family transcriptional regulator
VYKVTDQGSRQLGDNYGDLALILWRELNAIADPEIRADVQRRVQDAMVRRLGVYGEGRLRERLKTLAASLASRGFDVELNDCAELPVLREHNCPYLELAEEDRGVCEMERQVFEQALGTGVKLSQCCLDGHRYCEFEVSGHSA